MTDSFALIVNPVSGGGKGLHHSRIIARRLTHLKVSFSLYVTRYSGDEGHQLGRAVAAGYRHFIIIGGDGTLNKVINHVMDDYAEDTHRFSMGVIPSGTGNDWCRHHGISFDPLNALGVILRQKTMMHDAGHISFRTGNRYFLCISGTGFQGYVVQRISRTESRKSGRLFYYLKVLQYLSGYNSGRMLLSSDETVMDEAVFSVAVAVCRFNGGGMMQAPGAVANDGWLDVTVIRSMSKLGLLYNFPGITKGRHVLHPRVLTFRTKRLEIKGSADLFADCDGEPAGHGPFVFSIKPESVRMFIP